MTRKEKYDFVIKYFQQHIPNAETELLYKNTYQLLVAVILSAQCTDKRVNLTTPAILVAIPTLKLCLKLALTISFHSSKALVIQTIKPSTSLPWLICSWKIIMAKYL